MALALRARYVQESVGPATYPIVNIRNIIFAPVLLAVAASASALSLGAGSGAVVLGAPVDLSFVVQPDPGTDVASSCVTAKIVAGDTVISGNKVRVFPLPEVRGRPSGVRVMASIALDEPVLTVTLSAGCGGQTTRTYTFLSDLPATVPRYSSASPVDISRLPNVAGVAAAPAAPAAAGAKPTPSSKSGTQLASRAKLTESKEASIPPARVPSPVKPPKEGSALRSGRKNASVSQKTSAAPVPAPATARARLVLEPLDTLLDAPVALQPTSELPTAPSPDASAQRAQAAALWKSLNTPPEDLQKDGERLKALEANAAAARQQATKNQTDVAQLREQLERAEQNRFPAMVVYLLGALLLLALLVVAWIWTRLRRASKLAERAWRDSVNMGSRGVGATREAAVDLTQHPADTWIPPETLPTPDAFGPSSRAAPLSSRDAPLTSVVAAAVNTPFVTSNPVVSVPVSLPSDAPAVAALQPSLHIVKPEELFDIQQQAEFFISVGEHQQAINVLKKHIAEHRATSPLAYLELLRIYHTLSRAEDFSQLRSQFMEFFNAKVPDFSGFHYAGRVLFHYTEALAEIEAEWTTPAVVQLVEKFLFRRSGTQAVEPFDLAAYDDLLLLLSIAQTTPASARGAPPPRQRTTPVVAPLEESLVSETSSAALSPSDFPLDSLAASLEFDFELLPQRSDARTVGSVSEVPNKESASPVGQGIVLDLDLSEPVHLTLSGLPDVPVTTAPAAGQPVGFGMDNDLMELRLELESKKPEDK